MNTAPRATVFVVDDDLSVRRSLRRLLSSAGYDVVVCGSAEEFLAITDLPRPACLVVDVRMPGMTGLDLQDELRRAGRDLPLILSSGHVNPSSSARARMTGAIAFLPKPFPARLLLDALREGVERERDSGFEASVRRSPNR